MSFQSGEGRVKIPVIFAFDENYALPASVAIRSLVEAKAEGTSYEIIVLHGGLGARTRRRMETLAPIRWVKVCDSILEAWPRRWHCPMCYRLVMAEALPDVGKAVWCDCDVLFRCDLAELFRTDLDGYDWAAIPMERPDERAGIHRHWNETDTVFTSCCLVADLDHWRKARFAEKFARTASLHDESLLMPDLDVLNAAGARVKPLPIDYSVFVRLVTDGVSAPEYPWLERMFGAEKVRRAIETPKIVHFAGPPVKVWLQRLEEMPPIYRSEITRSPFWDRDRERGGVMAFAKFVWHSLAYAATREVAHRRLAGVYRRCLGGKGHIADERGGGYG